MVEKRFDATAGTDASDEDESGGLDLDSVREMVGFVLHAARRRSKLAVMTFMVVAAVGIAIAVTMPRTYSSQVRLLAQRSAVHALTGHNTMDDNPTKNVASMILRRDNLVELAKEADLAKRFYETRSRALKLKDQVMGKIFTPLTDEDKFNIVVFTLEKKLEVTVADDAIVTIAVEWSDPRLAYDIVGLVQKNFLEARYDSDVAVINDSIAVLEDHVKSEHAHVDAELDAYQKIVAEKVAASKLLAKADLAPLAVAMPGVVRAPGAPPPQPVDPDAIKDLEEKRLEIRATEEARQRTVEGLKQRLADAELTLTPMHPTVMALKQQVEAMSGPPPELAALRSEERALMAQIASPKVDVAPPPIVWPHAPTFYRRDSDPAADAEAPSAQPFAAQAVPTTPLERDGQLQLAQSQLGLAIAGYEDALARLDATKVELDITGAAYKHRYTVITPAELPRSPKKATAQLVGAGSVFGGAALALLLTTGLDLAGGLVLESWQVRRRLKLEIVGELDNPS